MLDDPDIAALLTSPALRGATANRVAAALVEAANLQGGSDNITVVALRAPGRHPGGSETSHVLDIDAPPVARRLSPVLLLLLGAALAVVLLLLLLAFVPALRPRMDRAAPTSSGAVTGAGASGNVDYASLVYDAPVRFAEFLARGDLLSYSRDAGLYFVAASSGKVALLSRTGIALKSVEKLEVADAPTTIPSTHVFMTADPQGNVYLSYTKRKVVEKKGTDGRLLATITGFERPEAIAVDDDGNLYVVDFNEIKVCRARPPKVSTPSPPRPSPS
jgi:hypothetical protein